MNAVLKPAPATVPNISEMVVTPEYAADLLALNTANRPLKKSLVEDYAAAMKRGEWMYNGDTICLSSDHVLLDGQHRLHAIVKSGIPQRYIIVRNLPPPVFITKDQGVKRSNADVLSIKGEKSSAQLAAAARWLLIGHRQGVYMHRRSTPAQIAEAVALYPELRRWVAFYVGHSGLRVLFDSQICAVAALFARKYGDEVIERFMQQLATGENLKRTDPAFELRARAIQNRSAGVRVLPWVMFQLTIKAFKAYVNGKQVGVLRMGANEEFPTI